MKVNGEQWKMLTEALATFPLSKFDRMLQFELDKDREAIALGSDKTQIVYEVIKEYNFRDQVEQLVLAARRFNPTDRQLFAVAQQFGIATQVDAVAYDDQGEPTVTPMIDLLRLERKIRDINPLLDVKQWVQKLMNTENRICRVENAQIPNKGIGTAFLVGSETVMTNYHVIKPFIDLVTGKLQSERLRLRFDYSVAPDGVSTPVGTVYSVAELLDGSPPSPYDDNPFPPEDAAPDKLDYALLKADGTPGDDPIGGRPNPAVAADVIKRGWIPMPADPYDFEAGAPLLIYQHPAGGPMKLAIETNAVESINDKKTRVRYRTNTDEGSSGSPCFDMDWNLVALHRAGGLLNNQGVPFAAILDLLTVHNKRHLVGQ